MVPRSTIHKQKRKFFALVFVSLCLSLSSLIFLKITLKCLRSSAVRYSNNMRKSSSPFFNYKRQQRSIVQIVWLIKPGEKQRLKLRKGPKNRKLQRRRKSQSIPNDSGTRCQRKRLLYQRGLKDPRLWNPSTRKLLLEIRRGNGPPKRLERSNWGSTAEVPQ